MINKNMMIISKHYPNIRLRSIKEEDLNHLRNWKNRNKTSFFYKKDISESEQKKWFEKYLERDEEVLFIVEEKLDNVYKSIGCMGFRKEKDYKDSPNYMEIYNIMRGVKYDKSTVKINQALGIMCSYIKTKYNKNIGCKVIKSNPAVIWYFKNGFNVMEDYGEYIYAGLDFNKFNPLEVEIVKGCET